MNKVTEKMEQNTTEDSSEDNLWDEGSFTETLGSEDIKTKIRTFHMKHDEEMNYQCKKCNNKISAHNKDWHAGLCDTCFDKKFHQINPEKSPPTKQIKHNTDKNLKLSQF